MVAAATWTCLALALLVAGPDPGSPVEADPAVRAALGREGYPWYDAPADALEPIPYRAPADYRLPGLAGLGRVLIFTVMALALTALVVGLAWAIRRWMPGDDPAEASPRPSRQARTGALPEALGVDVDDPWAEARRRRQAGDLAGAIVFLFAHQLLTLDRLGLSRLTPGKTPRQLVRAVQDRAVRSRIEPTLRLFERAYYGHEAPEADRFEAAWAEAEALERWAAAGVPS